MDESLLTVTNGGSGRTITLYLTHKDMMNVKLTAADRALFDDIENGPRSDTPIADVLLGLETLVRRIEEQKKKELEEKTA